MTDRVGGKKDILLMAQGLLEASSMVFGWLKEEILCGGKNKCVESLLEKGIVISNEFKKGLINFLDSLEKEMGEKEKRGKTHEQRGKHKNHKALPKQKALRHS